jgi:hypothetical protein
MKRDEMKTEALHETAAGPLERITFSDEDDREKSLLTLIEEHRPRQTRSLPPTASEIDSISSVNSPDIVDEDAGYRFDHQMMRLGGNGF